MPLSTPADAEDDWIRRAGRLLRDAVRPLYSRDRKNNPESVASCVLLELGGLHFVVSAAHAIPRGSPGESLSVFFLDGPNPLTPFASGEWVSTVGATEDPLEDPFDLAFVCLSSGDVSRIPSPHFLTAANIAGPMVSDAPSKYMVLGYPSNRQRRKIQDMTIEVEPWTFGLGEASAEAYRALASRGIDRSTHIAARFDQQTPMDRAGMRRPPKPTGMSGGGIWLFGNAFESVTPDSLPKLQGILIAYYQRPNPVMVAVRISVVLAIMCQVYPQLERSVEPLISRLGRSLEIHHHEKRSK